MASAGKAFIGKWKIQKWYPTDELPDWLVKEGADLDIQEGPTGYEVRWPDQEGGTCTLVPVLTPRDGELVGEARLSQVVITDRPESFSVTPAIAFELDTSQPTLIVSLAGGIVDGDPGTFTAEGPPRPVEEG